MKREDFSKGWRFSFSPYEEWSYHGAPKEGQRMVDLPHDFKLELSRSPAVPGGAGEAFYPGGVGYYQKTLLAGDAHRAILLFDGAYRITQVRVNRDLIKIHKGGYTPFLADLSGRLQPGENEILVSVDASLTPASRWYTGGGIYRHVTLLTGGEGIIPPFGVCIRTPRVSADTSHVRTITQVEAQDPELYTLRTSILDADGHLVAADEVKAARSVRQKLALHACRLWSPEAPYLYTLRSELNRDGILIDLEETRFGLRDIRVDAENGLMLNGQPLLLKGGCVHHDNGILGARSYPDAERRNVKKLKACGFNAIRCAHNPPSAALLDACDELGLLVIDEAFDCWREGKRQLDDHIFFEERWEAELEAMILRDRNHPSVILWSTGNEIVERSGVSDGAEWSRSLAGKVHRLDPTRPVTNAVCGFFEDTQIAEMAANSLSTSGAGKDYWALHSEDFLAPLDVAGYNYLLDRYEKDHGLYPGRVILGTESFPMQALENWQAVKRRPHVIGDFVWTAWDYLGEAGIGHSRFDGPAKGLMPFPWHLANCGDLDICGDKRPQSHYRDFVWSERTKPYIAVSHPDRYGQEEHLSPWGWPDLLESWSFAGHEGKKVRVTVYASGDEVELLLNGVSLGRQPCGEEHRYTAVFDVPYRPGLLEAVAYRDGRELDKAALETAGTPKAVQAYLETEPREVATGGLLYMQIYVADGEGLRVPDAQDVLTVSVTGGAELTALGCADPVGSQTYTGPSCHAYRGRMLAVLQNTGNGEPVRVSVSGRGLVPALLEFLF